MHGSTTHAQCNADCVVELAGKYCSPVARETRRVRRQSHASVSPTFLPHSYHHNPMLLGLPHIHGGKTTTTLKSELSASGFGVGFSPSLGCDAGPVEPPYIPQGEGLRSPPPKQQWGGVCSHVMLKPGARDMGTTQQPLAVDHVMGSRRPGSCQTVEYGKIYIPMTVSNPQCPLCILCPSVANTVKAC